MVIHYSSTNTDQDTFQTHASFCHVPSLINTLFWIFSMHWRAEYESGHVHAPLFSSNPSARAGSSMSPSSVSVGGATRQHTQGLWNRKHRVEWMQAFWRSHIILERIYSVLWTALVRRAHWLFTSAWEIRKDWSSISVLRSEEATAHI